MKLIASVLFVLTLATGQVALAESERLANYFTCSLEEGKSLADLVAFKASASEWPRSSTRS